MKHFPHAFKLVNGLWVPLESGDLFSPSGEVLSRASVPSPLQFFAAADVKASDPQTGIAIRFIRQFDVAAERQLRRSYPMCFGVNWAAGTPRRASSEPLVSNADAAYLSRWFEASEDAAS